MLSTQVQYWTLKEAERHNVKTEDLGAATLTENVRHNVVTEGETQRHNLVTEEETYRHNVATEQYYSNSLSETSRHNLETERQGMLNTLVNQKQADVSEFNAQTNRMNAETNRFSAVTGYSLGLTANQIAAENANTNARNAQLREDELDLARFRAVYTRPNEEAAVTNAHTNQLNAETRQGELKLGYDNLNFNQEKFDWQKYVDRADIFNETVRTQTQAASSISDIFTNLFKSVGLKAK